MQARSSTHARLETVSNKGRGRGKDRDRDRDRDRERERERGWGWELGLSLVVNKTYIYVRGFLTPTKIIAVPLLSVLASVLAVASFFFVKSAQGTDIISYDIIYSE